eukprot:TRINITY_DN2169_c0_g1_i1.p1 TRINITY_DN2169_c0_g1~~TRINITY_DN2169_c0_g1_i1.p1  ORF type:complete len:485 (-),score=38.94 TRINITY_DN2169_c0_g1_i1:2236-3690(-)
MFSFNKFLLGLQLCFLFGVSVSYGNGHDPEKSNREYTETTNSADLRILSHGDDGAQVENLSTFLTKDSVWTPFPDQPTKQEALTTCQANRKKWEALKIKNYRFLIKRSCFCDVNSRKQVIINVCGDDATAPYMYEEVNGIDKVFDVVCDALVDAENFYIEYHQTYFFPITSKFNLNQIFSDTDFAQLKDDDLYFLMEDLVDNFVRPIAERELGYVISEFEVLDDILCQKQDNQVDVQQCFQKYDDWQALDIQYYSFTIKQDSMQKLDEVEVTACGNNTSVPQHYENFNTVAKVFDFICYSIQDAYRFDLKYDEEYSFPVSSYIDFDATVENEERGHYLSNFKVLDQSSCQVAQSLPVMNNTAAVQQCLEQKLLWKSLNLNNYSYNIKRSCFCYPEEYVANVSISVCDGQGPEIVYYNDMNTIDLVFEYVCGTLLEVDDFDVTYDDEFFYPQFTYFKFSQDYMDDDEAYEIGNLLVVSANAIQAQ